MEATAVESLLVRYEHFESAMSKMWDLRSKDQFCDVAIKVDGKVFHCHRNILSVSSKYFFNMFTGRFQRSSSMKVTLLAVDVDLFESILLFIYTGSVIIDASNVFGWIHAAGFYGLASLEGHLIEFAKKICLTLPSKDILKMLIGAHTQGLKSLFRFLGEYIYGDFGFFSDSPEFINLTWNSLIELPSLTPNADKLVLTDTFVEGVLKWIRSQVDASADERNSYFEQLVKIVQDRKSFTNGIQHVFDWCKRAEQVPGSNAGAILGEPPPKLLRAFVPSQTDGRASMFTLHETYAGSAWTYSAELESANRFMKNVVIDDSLYTMIPSTDNPACARFSLHRRAYTGAPHISWYRCQSLTRPPCIEWSYEMCAMNNNIFAYNHFVSSSSSDIDDYPDFTKEDLNHGVILYKRDVDKWFPVPSPHTYRMSCMTCGERIVYLIGGMNSNGAVQAYDPRTRAWMKLPPTTGIYETAASCIRDGKVWVVGGVRNPTSVEIFDPVAGKWERGKDLIESRPDDWSQRVSWDSVLYGRTVVSFRNSSHSGILFSDGSKSTGWNTIPDLKPPFRDSRVTPGTKHNYIADMVVF